MSNQLRIFQYYQCDMHNFVVVGQWKNGNTEIGQEK